MYDFIHMLVCQHQTQCVFNGIHFFSHIKANHHCEVCCLNLKQLFGVQIDLCKRLVWICQMQNLALRVGGLDVIPVIYNLKFKIKALA